MATYDLCLYNGEEHLFDLRHRILSPVVDEFIVVESTHTFQAHRKVPTFQEGRYPNVRYFLYAPVIRPGTNPWDVETDHRRFLGDRLLDLTHDDDDVFILSDVDEIADPTIVTSFVTEGAKANQLWVLQQYFSYYYANLRSDTPWEGTRIGTVKTLRTTCASDMQAVRHLRNGVRQVPKAGWHFSYMMSAVDIQNKLKSFSHAEYSGDAYTSLDFIMTALRTRADLFHRLDMEWNYVPLEDETFPSALLAWLEQHPEFLLKE
jgi:beta-1,4-mannosyl-glycoprotein beta-1,4-N-acetylglucosaminyltransferase